MAAAAHRGRHRRPGRPDLGGPLALLRIPPEIWTVKPRLDILTEAQRRALRDTTGAAMLDEDQARVLLAALAAGQSATYYAGLRAQPSWADTQTALKETVSALGAVGAIWYVRRPDRSAAKFAAAAATTAALDMQRRNGELTPRFLITCEPSNPDRRYFAWACFSSGRPSWRGSTR